MPMPNDLGIFSLLGLYPEIFFQLLKQCMYMKIHCSTVCGRKRLEGTQMFFKRGLRNWVMLHTLEYMQLLKKKVTLLTWNDL